MWEYEDQTGDCSRSPEGLGKEEGVCSDGRGKAEKHKEVSQKNASALYPVFYHGSECS